MLSNSIKHAFVKGIAKPEINVTIKPTSELGLRLNYSDNGVGMSGEDSLASKDSLGLEIVGALVEQLDGEMEFKIDNGTHFNVDFVRQKV